MISALVQIEKLGHQAKLHNNISLFDSAVTQLHVARQSCSIYQTSTKRFLDRAIARLEKQ